jgi:energy-converting hydrogenase Eha subunit H
MTRTQCFALGVVLAVMGAMAFFQILDLGPFIRLVSIGALGAVSMVASMVFFLGAFRDRD